MNRKGFFFSLLAFLIIIMFFFFVKSLVEKRANEAMIATDKSKFGQYEGFITDLSRNYIPSQVRLIVKKALVNLSFNQIYLNDIPADMMEILLTGNFSGTTKVINAQDTFPASMDRVHAIWQFRHSYSYSFTDFDLVHKDWQNLSATYTIHVDLSAPDLEFSTDIMGRVDLTIFGLNTSQGIIQPRWLPNATNDCVLNGISPLYACGWIIGVMPN